MRNRTTLQNPGFLGIHRQIQLAFYRTKHRRATTEVPARSAMIESPCIDIEILFRKVSGDDCSVRELSSCQSLQRLSSRVRVVELDEDLANSIGLPAAHAGTWYFNVDDLSVFSALFAHIFDNFLFQLVIIHDVEFWNAYPHNPHH